MERVLSLCVGSVAVGTVGLLILLKVVQRLRHKQNVQDKVVVITGASSGLGKGYSNSHNNAVLSMTFDLISFHWLFVLHHSASIGFSECARLFHAAGARLILCGRDQKRLQEVVDELTAIPCGKMRVKIFTFVCVHACVVMYHINMLIILSPN